MFSFDTQQQQQQQQQQTNKQTLIDSIIAICYMAYCIRSSVCVSMSVSTVGTVMSCSYCYYERNGYDH
eukprot:7772-Heterococcus_DN1.PRE.1